MHISTLQWLRGILPGATLQLAPLAVRSCNGKNDSVIEGEDGSPTQEVFEIPAGSFKVAYNLQYTQACIKEEVDCPKETVEVRARSYVAHTLHNMILSALEKQFHLLEMLPQCSKRKGVPLRG